MSLRPPIGGAAGPDSQAVLQTLTGRLGPGARLLDPSLKAGLLTDADACWLDGAPIGSAGAWQAVIDGGRLGEVEGAFALAWLDSQGSLHLARDPIGHRSLYWTVHRQTVIFSSSLQAVVAARRERPVLSPLAVATYLSCAYVPGEGTLVEGVFALLGGQEVIFHHGSRVERRFWTLPSEPRMERTEAELLPRLRRTLEAAVRRRLPEPGAPAGASLSGGIDSSAIVALLSRLHDGPITTYSVSFGPEHKNELEWSGLVAKHCGVEQRIVQVGPEDVLQELDRTTAALSEPNGDPLTVPNTLLFRLASERSPILFNGEGGDPCFGGPKNAPMLLAELLGEGPIETERTRERDYLRAHQKCFEELQDALQADFYAKISPGALEGQLTPWFDDPRWPGFLNKLMAINVVWKGAHHILPKVDQLGRASGMFPRSPLFDREVVELAFELPGALKRRGAEEKYLLKRAVADLLPEAIVMRPKSGMMVPVEGWFQGPLLPRARERLLEGLTPHGIFERSWLERLLGGKLPGLRPRRGVKIWLLVTLESWLRSLPSG